MCDPLFCVEANEKGAYVQVSETNWARLYTQNGAVNEANFAIAMMRKLEHVTKSKEFIE